ncbi:aconitate hydratase AcnA [Swingsia samuiensis]|uniref:Aconitate hydratase n=1 Tax=Swingsia samuiensis TaxID=1293412 RepID=A0A4Y6UJ78_9PROT|nr:aconitate hydratase AcnA [Swingsia samuiensis]QDH16688.1 aconitate hydratase AcnA [Swingsia samuiensis]
MKTAGQKPLKNHETLTVSGREYNFFSIHAAAEKFGDITHLPISLKILLENILRFSDDQPHASENAQAVVDWVKQRSSHHEIPFKPARILMQDFTGVPAVVDLAAMRDGIIALNQDPRKVNPLVPVDLVIDHSVMVDVAGRSDSLQKNVSLEFQRNHERYAFLRWGQEAFDQFRVVPPGAGICHQINLEYLSQVVWTKDIDGVTFAYPDTLFGTDSHTTMVNGLGVLGWGVGGIEAEAAMLGQPISMLIPDVVGVRLEGILPEGTTATDLVLTITEALRAKGVVGKFVEFYGSALDHLPVADRATIANMAPEYGATCGFFPVDSLTLEYLHQTGRSEQQIALVEAYLRAQSMFRDSSLPDPVFSSTVTVDLSSITPSLAGPKRPQDRVDLSAASSSFQKELTKSLGVKPENITNTAPLPHENYALEHGSIVIAAITSCTNTSNPAVLIAAGLVARKARALGLKPQPWVKTSLAPGSQVVTDYLDRAGLTADLNALGFETVGYGCTTCIGNSGPLAPDIIHTIEAHKLVAVSVLSGNRNFEGRISPQVRANYLASPPLVVAYSLLGTMSKDITTATLGHTPQGHPITLKDIWPSHQEIASLMSSAVTREAFVERYKHITQGTAEWQSLASADTTPTFKWQQNSTYIQSPPYFTHLTKEPTTPSNIENARILALLGDNITTDHISPAGSISPSSPAGMYLQNHQVPPQDFNSYGARRGNDRIMVRGTFANIRIRNEMAPGTEGGMTTHHPDGTVMSIYDAAELYKKAKTPLVIFGGKEYGMGSSRDWAAKGTHLLGIKAVIAESFERIHRSNLVGMGVLPLTFEEGTTRNTLKLTGEETITITGIDHLLPKKILNMTILYTDGHIKQIPLLCRIDTLDEVEYYKNGGILPYVLRDMAKA